MKMLKEAIVLGILVWASTMAPAEAKVEGQFAVAVALPGSLNDGSWNATAYRAAKQVEQTMGIKVTVQEHVSPADAERIFRSFASQGYDLVIGHTFLYLDPIHKVAGEFPQTAFLQVPGLKTRKNLGWGENPMFEGYYLCGVIAGLLTKTNKIGAVAGFEIPDTTAMVEAFRVGAQSTNPKVDFLATYAGTWHDAQKGKEAAIAMVEAGADVVNGFGNGLTLGVVRGAAEKGVHTFGYVGNMSKVAPKVIVSSVLWDLYSLYTEVVLQVMNGTFEGKKFSFRMDRGGVVLAPYGIDLSADIRKKVDESRQKIISGELKVPYITKATVGGKKN